MCRVDNVCGGCVCVGGDVMCEERHMCFMMLANLE